LNSICDHLADIQQRIAACEASAGRPPGSVTLLAVSKHQSIAKIRAAAEAGQRHLGENYLQEALIKMPLLDDLPIEWHFIGHIQSNKTRGIASHFDWVHSVSSARVAQRLSDQRPASLPPLNICLQVNLHPENGREGIIAEELREIATLSAELPRLRLRGIMAGSDAAQERLDQIVRVVAIEMVAEVCSAYVMRAGEVLELFATEGLRPEAVHRTRLRVGEGLVGRIAAAARPLALADAQAHPDFAYRPETGEEIYHSLMGVPVLRDERVLGVLAIQNRTWRQYSEDDVETLQTIAMIVAELVASGELVNPHEMAESRGGASLPMRLGGLRLNPGLAVAPALLHEPHVVIRHIVAEDIDTEERRLRDAVAAMQQGIDQLFEQVVRVAKPGARFCFRNFVGHTEIPERFRNGIVEDEEAGRRAILGDRSCLQARIVICRIVK